MRYRWLILFTALLLADSATKVWNATPSWGWHVVPTPTTAMWAGVVGMLLMTLWHVTRLPAVLAASGAIGNSLWTYNPRGVANPFVMGTGQGQVAFNFADVCLTLAIPVLVVCLTLWLAARYTSWCGIRTSQPRSNRS